jgi:Protein of unknown function (DUF4238)
MGRRKRNQHYVFQGYLRPWADRGLIYCLREGRVFHPNLTGVACERYFYRLQDLTPSETKLVEEMFSDHPSDTLKALQKHFMSLYSLPTKLRKQLSSRAQPKRSSALDQMIAEGQEDYHQRIEDDLLVFIGKMLAGDTDFYSDAEQAANFLHSLCVQFTRTKRTIEAVVELVGEVFRGRNTRRMMSVLGPLMAIALAQGLFVEREDFKLLVVENNTKTPFITTDQPIINLHFTNTREPPQEFEFYYPLSPAKAMFLVKKSSRRGDLPFEDFSVNTYNTMMLTNSYQQVFSNSEEYLKSIKNVVTRS